MTRDGSKTTLVAKKTIWWNLANLKNPSVSRMHVFSLHPVSGGVDPIINHMVFTNVPMAKSHEILSKPASLQAATAKLSHYMVVAQQKHTNQPLHRMHHPKKQHESRIPPKKKGSGPTFKQIWPPISTSFRTNTKTFTQNNFRKQLHLPHKVGPKKPVIK